MGNTVNKSIKTIILSFAITGIVAGSSVHAGLSSLIRRCFATSIPARDCEQGKMLKKLAEPYGLQCKYPVFVSHNAPTETAAARLAFDDGAGKSYDKNIIFNADWFNDTLKRGNKKLLIAVLFHENAHLDLDHKAKELKLLNELNEHHHSMVIQKLNDYADDIAAKGTSLEVASKAVTDYGNTLLKAYKTALDEASLKITRAHEYEADASIAHHADLCFAASADYRSERNLSIDVAGLQYSFGATLSKPTLSLLYQKACEQNAEAYEQLEKNDTHPLNGRRSAYLLDMAWNAPIRKSLPQHYTQWAHARADLALMLHAATQLLQEEQDKTI